MKLSCPSQLASCFPLAPVISSNAVIGAQAHFYKTVWTFHLTFGSVCGMFYFSWSILAAVAVLPSKWESDRSQFCWSWNPDSIRMPWAAWQIWRSIRSSPGRLAKPQPFTFCRSCRHGRGCGNLDNQSEGWTFLIMYTKRYWRAILQDGCLRQGIW